MSPDKRPFALVVDDNAVQNEISVAVMRKFGFDAEATTTSTDFIKRLKEVRPDVCLVDLNIESLGVGFTIIKAVRNVLGPDLPIIVVSGRYDSEAIQHAIEIGADDFVTKPLDREVLATKLSRHISTEALLSAKANLFPVPEGGVPATTSVQVEIASVDEFGFTIVSPHLLSKGAVIHIDSPLVHEITGRTQPILVNIQSAWMDLGPGLHVAYAEFDDPEEDLLSCVRKWLSNPTA